jgi:TolA-binding protein
VETGEGATVPEAPVRFISPDSERLARLEDQVAALQKEIADLKQQFAEFRKQFE